MNLVCTLSDHRYMKQRHHSNGSMVVQVCIKHSCYSALKMENQVKQLLTAYNCMNKVAYTNRISSHLLFVPVLTETRTETIHINV